MYELLHVLQIREYYNKSYFIFVCFKFFLQ